MTNMCMWGGAQNGIPKDIYWINLILYSETSTGVKFFLIIICSVTGWLFF
jgi:hypothetical protein